MMEPAESSEGLLLGPEYGHRLERVCVGLDWGAPEDHSWFGLGHAPVDLDSACALYGANGELLDLVYFGKRLSADGAVCHGGDDLTGDMEGDDEIDNEVIAIDLNRVAMQVDSIAVLLTCFECQDFQHLPYARIRVYEGTPTRVENLLSAYQVASNPDFAGAHALWMGWFRRDARGWQFRATGQPLPQRDLHALAEAVRRLLPVAGG